MVRLAGIEPTTPWFVAKYSIQLSYSRNASHFSLSFLTLSGKTRFFFINNEKSGSPDIHLQPSALRGMAVFKDPAVSTSSINCAVLR